MKKNKEAKEELILTYGCRCMATNMEVSEKRLTFHHLKKAEYGGQATVENGINLIDGFHCFLHNFIEYRYPLLFDDINTCLKSYKLAVDIGNKEIIEMFEKEISPIFYKVYKIYLEYLKERQYDLNMALERICLGSQGNDGPTLVKR